MALPPLPRVLNLTEIDEESIDIANGAGQAIMQDASYEQGVFILDQDGEVFDLGPTGSPRWEFHAQCRSDVYDNDTEDPPQLTFTVVVEDGPGGIIKFKANPSETAAINVPSGRWDLQMTNVTDPAFDVGFRAPLFYGAWRLFQDVTRV